MAVKDILKDAKTLGGIGAILLVCAFAPYIGIACLIAGIILILIAYNKAANYSKRKEIWRRTLNWFILNIINMVILVIFVIIGFLAFASIQSLEIPSFAFPGFALALIIIGLVAIYTINIVAARNFLKANEALAKVTNQGMFRTAGLLNFIGAITIIVFGLGAIVSWVGNIILAIAFFSVENK